MTPGFQRERVSKRAGFKGNVAMMKVNPDHPEMRDETLPETPEIAQLLDLTEAWRADADKSSQRLEAFWLSQQQRIEQRLAEERVQARWWRLNRDGPLHGTPRPVIMAAGVLITLVFTLSWVVPWSALNVSSLSSGTLSSGTLSSGPSLEDAPVRSPAELRRLFSEVGDILARDEPLALSASVPIREALSEAMEAGSEAGSIEQHPWNHPVSIHLEKEL